ncbi:MAG: hypothetical protein MJE77_09655 [Proteobacteria bacterium]|nr:hypothetical protein [Pseudomonadota bacterium]
MSGAGERERGASGEREHESGSRGGLRRARYDNGLGSGNPGNLEAAETAGYIVEVPHQLRRRLDHLISALVKLVY